MWVVKEKLESLQAYLGSNDAELRKVVIPMPSVLGFNHGSVVKQKMEPTMRMLGLTLDQLKAKVVAYPLTLCNGHIENKWAIMMSRFDDEEEGGKVTALRSLRPRGLGVGLLRLERRLAGMLGCKPKASECFQRLVMYTDTP